MFSVVICYITKVITKQLSCSCIWCLAVNTVFIYVSWRGKCNGIQIQPSGRYSSGVRDKDYVMRKCYLTSKLHVVAQFINHSFIFIIHFIQQWGIRKVCVFYGSWVQWKAIFYFTRQSMVHCNSSVHHTICQRCNLI